MSTRSHYWGWLGAEALFWIAVYALVLTVFMSSCESTAPRTKEPPLKKFHKTDPVLVHLSRDNAPEAPKSA